MTTALDVLLIETEPYVGLHSATQLARAGHRVHRCYPTGASSCEPAEGSPRLCTALSGGTCPIDAETIDVAVVAGPASSEHLALTAAGVTCALRAHIPLVADDSCSTSFGARDAQRANGDVVGACARAADGTYDELRVDVLRRIGPALAVDGIDVARVEVDIAAVGPRLTVSLAGPPIERSLRQTLGVRVLDAVRSAGRVFGQVDVRYETLDDKGPPHHEGR
jgi:hypothetical protein